MDPRKWNTYYIGGYTGGGQDPRATGGVRLSQVRRTKFGVQTRDVNTNGRFQEVISVEAIADMGEGEALLARAESFDC